MYLKTLEMQGFKSFPDKTVIAFRPGVTAIVGANGSGKSNISDAVRWVLGEMSPKTLRGGKMEDVIFNGTAKRRPAGYAEVVMTIDNSDSLMKIDYDEVSVARRLYRTGESEYYINKKQVRLKDVVDLFLNTGIGKEGYSVIGQGKISEIISQKGDERREVFEEAAGISRFRYRKTEAVNKLAKVNDNAVRIGDIIAEVETRLPSLESQADKATKFLTLDGEKKALELAICAARLRVIDGERSAVDEKYKSGSAELNRLTDELAKLETKLDEMYVQNQRNNVEAERLRGGISEKSGQLASSAGRLSVLENDIRHYKEKIEETRRELCEVEGQIKLIGSTGSEADEKLAVETAARDALKAEYDGKKSALYALDEKISTLKSTLAGLSAEIAALGEVKQKNELLESENEGFSRAREDRLTLLGAERDRIAAEKAGKTASLEACRAEAEKIGKQKSLLEAKLAEIYSADANIELDIEEKRSARETSRLKQLESEQRRETLLRMDRLLEGFSGSVKEVMSAAESGELKGIYGPISKLIKTDEKYITAIETTLGAGMQHIVCEDEKCAKAAIEFLKRTRSGRATFLPLTTIRPDPVSVEGISERGFLGRADSLIECDEKFASVATYVLGRTAVAEDIESADRIAKTRGYNLKIVSLDGQIINAGGSFTGGQQLHRTGILSRNADIAALDSEIEKLKKKNEALKAELNELSDRQAKQKNEIKRLNGELAETESTLVRQSGAVEIEEKLLAAVNERLEAVAAELGGISTSKEEESTRLAELIREKEDAAKRLEESIKKNDELTAALTEATSSREQLFLETSELSSRLALCEQKILQAENERASVTEQLSEREQTVAGRKEAISALEAQTAAAKAEIESLVGAKDALAAEIEADKAHLDQVRAMLDEYDKNSYSMRDSQKQMTAEKEKLIDSVGRLEGKLNAIDREKESFIVRLREEYELDENSPELTEIPDGRAKELGGKERLNVLKQDIRRLGPVNVESIDELKETRERYDFLSAQYADIQSSREGLEKLIGTLEKTMREMFLETFEKVREGFKETFTELFGGGSADIVLTDSDDVLQSGIEINIQPPGKLVKSLSLLSGGEQAFVAIALYFALLKVNPSPFCIFDEIESALDEANVFRFGDYLRRNCDKTQFIVITHRRGTMESASMLYGIAMQEKGVSDYIKLVPGDIKFKDDTIIN